MGRNTVGEDVMLQMGGDFGFENANEWFKNLDILIGAVNREGRVNVSEKPYVYICRLTSLVLSAHRTPTRGGSRTTSNSRSSHLTRSFALNVSEKP